MIPKTAPCRCGRPVEIRGGAMWSGCGDERHDFWFAGGPCHACGRFVQYGFGGNAHDYRHARWWYTGDKHYESAPGMVRRWPAEWGYVEHLSESIQ